MNPFHFGDPVTGQYYLDRPDLNKLVSQFVDSKINTVLIGPRRYGKTSFILNLLREIKNKKASEVLYIDLFNITGHRDFYLQLIMAIKKERGVFKNFTSWLKTIPDNLKPSLSVEAASTGNIEFSLQPLKSDVDIKQMILIVLEELIKNSKSLIIAFDEFQAVAEIEDEGWLEATLREKMQLNKNCAFIFSGSRRAIIHEMFNNSRRPFYRSCQMIDFPVFGNEFTKWIEKKFEKINVECEEGAIDYLRKTVEETPNYVQMACFHIVALGMKKIDKAAVDQVLKTMVAQNAYAYQTLLRTLSINQQRVLRMSAKHSEGIFNKDLIEKFEISSPQHVAQAIKALKEKQILDEETGKGKVVFDDPLFAIWLNLEF